jgi:N-acetylmuramoyl-L-alanine amidase
MAKISINAGHTLSGPGAGAEYKGLTEAELTRLVARLVTDKLTKKGHTVHDSTVDRAASQNAYLDEVVNRVNRAGVDLFISIHCNASLTHTGHGVECFTWKREQVPEAVRICSNISALGFRNRGIKDGSALRVVKNTHPTAILVELFFMDNTADRQRFMEHGADKLAEAIVKAI